MSTRSARSSTRGVVVLLIVLALVPASFAQRLPVADALRSPISCNLSPRGKPRSVEIPGLLLATEPMRTPGLDVDALLAEDATSGPGPLRMGVVQDIEYDARGEQWTALPGGWLCTLRILAGGARAVRVRIPALGLPPDSELTVFSASDPANSRGPFSGAFVASFGEFWTPTIYTDDIYLEYFLPERHDHQDAAFALHPTGVLNQYRSRFTNPSGAEETVSCHLDAMCYPGVSGLRDGVGALAFVDNLLPYGFFCSGAMLNRSPADFTRLFMTATHCGVSAAVANTVEVTWLWQTDYCAGTVPDPNTLPQSLGATVLVRDVTTDWTLMGLQNGEPAQTLFEGWDANHWTNMSGAVSISHPQGSYKRVAFGIVLDDHGARPNPAGGNACIAGNAYSVEFWSGNGLTEPGSSGSPIFDGLGRVHGAESCATAATCVTGESNFAYYGAFDLAFPMLAPFMTPVDPVYVNYAYGGPEIGSVGQPFNTLVEGIYAVIGGSDLNIDAGQYQGRLRIEKPMTLLARNGQVRIGQ